MSEVRHWLAALPPGAVEGATAILGLLALVLAIWALLAAAAAGRR